MFFAFRTIFFMLSICQCLSLDWPGYSDLISEAGSARIKYLDGRLKKTQRCYADAGNGKQYVYIEVVESVIKSQSTYDDL